MPNPSDVPNPSVSAARRGKYYHETVAFEVEGVVHRVCKYGFEKWSQSGFRDMFSLPQGTDENGDPKNSEGDTDDNPIKLVGCTNAEFESLIEVMYPLSLKGPPALTKEQWAGVLKLSRLWDMPEVAAIAIERLSAFELKAVEKIKLGKEHGVPTWLKEGYIALVDDLSNASLTEMTILGWETAFRILWARDEIAKSQATQNSGGYWVNLNKLCCGYCWRHYGSLYPIVANATSCTTNCGVAYSSGVTVINAPYTTLTTTSAPTIADAKSKLVADKVAEVFEEELKNAERRNALPTT